MQRGNLRRHYHLNAGILFLLLSFLWTGCGPSVATPPAVMAAIPCVLDASDVNTYKVTPVGVVPTIYSYISNSPDPSQTVTDPVLRTYEARYAALNRLKDEAERWTKKVTIPLDETSQAQILVTFLSPELIQAVYLNNLLKHTTRPADIQSGVQAALYQFAAREQLIFLVTVLATSQNHQTSTPHSMDIPLSQMILMNAENLAIPPSHDDHNLDQPIDLTKDPVHGFVYYPLAVIHNEVCTQVLDPVYNTKIIIETSSLVVDGADSGIHNWTIPYVPLLLTDNFHYEPDYQLPLYSDYPSLDRSLLSARNQPPNNTDDPNFWLEFGRFIWGQLTLEDY